MALTTLMTNERFDELLNDIYNAVISGDWQQSLKKITLATKSNKGFFNIVDIEKSQLLEAAFDFQFNYDPKVLMLYLDNPHEDPFYQVIKHLPQGSVYDFSEFIDISEYSETDFYKVILSPMKSHHVIGSTFIRDGKYDSTFAINRGPDDKPYSENELHFIQLITPHYQRAVKLYNALNSEKRNCLLSEAMLARVNQPIMMLDKSCQILLHSHRAKMLIDSSALFSLGEHELSLNDESVNKTFKNVVSACCNQKYERADYSIFLEDNVSHQVLRLSVSPLPNSLSLNNLDVDAAIVIIHSNQFLDIEALKQEYSLTVKEAEVLKMYYHQQSIEEVSEFLGCTKFTVRNHLQAMYKKMKVTSQIELMSKLRIFLN